MKQILIILTLACTTTAGIHWVVSNFFFAGSPSYLALFFLGVGLFLLFLKFLPDMNIILDLSDYLEKGHSWLAIGACFALWGGLLFYPTEASQDVEQHQEAMEQYIESSKASPTKKAKSVAPPKEKVQRVEKNVIPVSPSSPSKPPVLVENITGIIRKSIDHSPIQGASIKIGDKTCTSKSSGKFLLTSVYVAESGVEIEVTKKGFFTWSDILSKEKIEQAMEIDLRPKLRVWLPDFNIETPSLQAYQKEIPKLMKSAFVDCDEMEVVARGEDLDLILQEISLNQDNRDIFDPEEIVETGKAIGANYVITGSLTPKGQEVHLQVEMFDMRRGVIAQQIELLVEESNIENASRYASLAMLAKTTEVKIASVHPVRAGNSRLIQIKGNNTCLPQGWHLWISVQPAGVDKHFPQNFATIDNGSWVVPNTYCGNERDHTRTFQVYAILADPQSHQIFQDYIDGKKFSGLDLPKGARICDSREHKRN